MSVSIDVYAWVCVIVANMLMGVVVSSVIMKSKGLHFSNVDNIMKMLFVVLGFAVMGIGVCFGAFLANEIDKYWPVVISCGVGGGIMIMLSCDLFNRVPD